MEEKTESHGETLHSSKHEGGGDIIDVQLEHDPVPGTEEKETGEDAGGSVEVEDAQTQTDLDTAQSQACADTQTSPDTLVAPISGEACDSPSVSDPAAAVDSALNPDGNDRKSVDEPVDPPVPAVIDHDQDLPTKNVDEPTDSEMFSAKDNDDQAQSIVDTPLSEETKLPQSPRSASPALEPQPHPQAHPAPPAPTPALSNSPYLPRLTAPTMFLPIPNTDPLSPLLTKHVPPEQRPRRDVTGEWTSREMHEMVMSNSWRALARMARDLIVASDPEDLSRILDLWSLRLSALARLRLTNQASAECTNLFAVLNAIPPTASAANLASSTARVLATRLSALSAYPFELSVLRARVHYWAGDVRGYVDALAGLLAGCKAKARAESKAANLSMWLERSARVCLMIASQLVEMKDYHAAITLLTPLCTQQLSPRTDAPPVPSPAIHSAVARIHLLSGNIPKAAEHFKIVASCADVEPGTVAMNTALLCSASGDWQRAEAALRDVLEQDPRNYTAMNNLAVTSLAQGRVRDGIGLLEQAMRASPASVLSAEPFIFNLSTLYELRSSTAIDKKRELLIEVARWGGDGLRATCLKMPSS
ncbi:hypothetical protein EDD15DRAFT_2165028 [Pisolithus albus]|nr:hypothetical protein EDD15DRAFT_2165028 [Pisolithus albus]